VGKEKGVRERKEKGHKLKGELTLPLTIGEVVWDSPKKEGSHNWQKEGKEYVFLKRKKTARTTRGKMLGPTLKVVFDAGSHRTEQVVSDQGGKVKETRKFSLPGESANG